MKILDAPPAIRRIPARPSMPATSTTKAQAKGWRSDAVLPFVERGIYFSELQPADLIATGGNCLFYCFAAQ